MAYARLGVVYINTNQVAKADKYFAKAYALSKNVSERERLYITGHYYQNVTGDMPRWWKRCRSLSRPTHPN